MDATLAVDCLPRPAAAGWTLRALLTLTAPVPPAAPGAPARVPLTLALVLDRSGSMEGAPLEAARRAAAGLVRRLRPDDVVGVVAYDDRVDVVAEPAGGAEQARLAQAIEGITSGGSTNLSGGSLRGRELVDAARGRRADAAAVLGAAADNLPGAPAADAPGACRVVLLTDGLANAGITDPRALVALCAHARAAGVTTTTVGFGPGYDEHLLRAMADAGGGNSYYVEHADQARDVFAEEVEGLLGLGAQDVRVAVRPASGPGSAAAAVVGVRVHHDWPGAAARAADDGVRLELGDLYAREPKAVLVEWTLASGPEVPPAGVVAEFVVSGYVVGDAGTVERVTLTLPVVAGDATAGPLPAIEREVLVQAAARARAEALAARDRGDPALAARALRAAALSLASAPCDAPDAAAAELAGEAADLEAMAAAFEAGHVSDADAKYLGQMAYDTARGRRRSKARLRRG